jgi:hypothetical protein
MLSCEFASHLTWSRCPAQHLRLISRVQPDGAAAKGARHCCICAEGATDEYLGGGWFHSEGHANGSKRPIVNVVRCFSLQVEGV